MSATKGPRGYYVTFCCWLFWFLARRERAGIPVGISRARQRRQGAKQSQPCPAGRGGGQPSAALRVAYVPTGTHRSTRLAYDHPALPPKCNVISAWALRCQTHSSCCMKSNSWCRQCATCSRRVAYGRFPRPLKIHSLKAHTGLPL